MAVDNVALFQAIQARAIKELVPKMRVGPKTAFWIHAAINWLLNIFYPKTRQDAYLKRYNTTLGYTVAMATDHGDDSRKFGNWRTLCHEIKHVLQAMKWTRVVFGGLYLWPISQGILLLLTCWLPVFWASGWWLAIWIPAWAVIAGLHFIPQLPDPWREHWEFQGYSISMHLCFLIYGRIEQAYIDALVRNFHSMMYFIMSPNEKKIRERLAALATKIEMGQSPVKDEPIIIIAEEEYERLAA